MSLNDVLVKELRKRRDLAVFAGPSLDRTADYFYPNAPAKFVHKGEVPDSPVILEENVYFLGPREQIKDPIAMNEALHTLMPANTNYHFHGAEQLGEKIRCGSIYVDDFMGKLVFSLHYEIGLRDKEFQARHNISKSPFHAQMVTEHNLVARSTFFLLPDVLSAKGAQEYYSNGECMVPMHDIESFGHKIRSYLSRE